MITILGQSIKLIRPEKIHQPQKTRAIVAQYNKRSKRIKLTQEEICRIKEKWKGIKFEQAHSWD